MTRDINVTSPPSALSLISLYTPVNIYFLIVEISFLKVVSSSGPRKSLAISLHSLMHAQIQNSCKSYELLVTEKNKTKHNRTISTLSIPVSGIQEIK